MKSINESYSSPRCEEMEVLLGSVVLLNTSGNTEGYENLTDLTDDNLWD